MGGLRGSFLSGSTNICLPGSVGQSNSPFFILPAISLTVPRYTAFWVGLYRDPIMVSLRFHSDGGGAAGCRRRSSACGRRRRRLTRRLSLSKVGSAGGAVVPLPTGPEPPEPPEPPVDVVPGLKRGCRRKAAKRSPRLPHDVPRSSHMGKFRRRDEVLLDALGGRSEDRTDEGRLRLAPHRLDGPGTGYVSAGDHQRCPDDAAHSRLTECKAPGEGDGPPQPP